MKITKDNIKHLAKLSRLSFNDEELKEFEGEFQEIINYFEMIDNVDTSNIIVDNIKLDSKNDLREDVVIEKFTQEEVVSGTKESHKGMISVPKIIG